MKTKKQQEPARTCCVEGCKHEALPMCYTCSLHIHTVARKGRKTGGAVDVYTPEDECRVDRQ